MFHSNLIGDIPIFVGYHVRWEFWTFAGVKHHRFPGFRKPARCTASTVPTTRTALAARGSYWPRASGCSRKHAAVVSAVKVRGWGGLNHVEPTRLVPLVAMVKHAFPMVSWGWGSPFVVENPQISKVIFDDFWWSTWINLPIFDAQLKGPISSRWSLHFCRASPRFSTGGIYMFIGEIAYFFIFWLNLQCFMVKSQFFGCLNQCLCISCRLNQSFRRFNLFHSNCLRFRFEFCRWHPHF